MLVLGVETSCDDTAAAVVQGGRTILASVVSSQDQVHSPYGGVVPELASRHHIKNVLPIVDDALRKAGATLNDLDGIADYEGVEADEFGVILKEYLQTGRATTGRVGGARAELIDGHDLVSFAVDWIVDHAGRAHRPFT